MKNFFLIITIISAAPLYSEESNATSLLSKFNEHMREKDSFLQKHDKLKLLQRISTICKQLQEVCRESQTICKERRFALDRELSILIQLYLKQLAEGELAQLKNIIKNCHDTQHKIFADPVTSKEFSQRQKNCIELIFI